MNGRTGEETFQDVDVQFSFILIIIRELRFFPQDEVSISRLLKLIYCDYELRLWTLLRNYQRLFMFRNIMYHVLYIPMYHDTFNLPRQKDNVAEKYLQSDVVSSHFFCTMFDQ